jgi:hypothetical protein
MELIAVGHGISCAATMLTCLPDQNNPRFMLTQLLQLQQLLAHHGLEINRP